VGSAVFASTLTTIAVFFPIVFVEGVAGQVFGDMALTVVFSLLASLAVALFLIPMLSSRQTSQFIAGAQIGNFLKQNILSYPVQAEAEALVSDKPGASAGGGIVKGLRIIAEVLWNMILNSAKLIAAMTITLIKFFTLPLILVLMPVFAFLRLIRVIKFRISDVVINYAENQDFFFVTFIKEVWPGYLVNKSLPTFYADLKKLISWFRDLKIIRILFSPVLFVFMVIKYLFQIFTEVGFRVFHILLSILSLLIKGLIILFKLIFTKPIDWVVNGFNYLYGKLEEIYPRMLIWSLEHKARVISGLVGVFAFTVFIIGPNIGTDLIPEVHQGEFNVELTLPVGTPAERTDERVRPIQEFIEKLDGVRKVASVIGIDKKESTNTDEGEHTAKLTVSLERVGNIKKAEERLISEIRSYMSSFSGVQAKISRPTIFSFKTPVEVEIHGYNLQDLQQVSRSVAEEMHQVKGLFDVKANIQRGNPEVQIIYNRPLLARYGLNIMDVASIVRNKVRGDVATEFKEEDRKIDVLVRVRDEDKESIENLRRLIINPGEPRPLPLEAVADLRVNEGPSEIRRIDQQRTAVITANISGRDLGSISEDIYQILRTTDMPDDFTFDIAGQNKEMETSLNSLMLALGLAIFLVYIVMASQFESLVHPFIIIFTIPMALIGVLIFLYVFNIPASIVVFLGGIMLAGIVVNNAIVLVDYINHLRSRGMEKGEAIVLAGKVRLRPILMTTSTTVLGLLPMALGLGDGAEIRTPMAITVIVGLITSTILTLLVIPTVYSVFDRKA
jgi:multidrug efflux pump subunit AcrB